MAFKVIYDPDEHCVHATIWREIDLALAHEYVREIIEQLNAHNCLRLLNDMRRASVRLSTIDIYELPAWVEEAGMKRFCKRALLVAQSFDDYRFYETVARNHGHLVAVFSDSNKTGIFRDMAAAREWLGLTPAKPASGRKRSAPAPAEAQDGPTTGS